MTKKRTYLTNAETLEFAEWLLSDERRLKLQKECQAKLDAGMINPIPWSILVRQVTKEDLNEWKKLKGL